MKQATVYLDYITSPHLKDIYEHNEDHPKSFISLDGDKLNIITDKDHFVVTEDYVHHIKHVGAFTICTYLSGNCSRQVVFENGVRVMSQDLMLCFYTASKLGDVLNVDYSYTGSLGETRVMLIAEMGEK